MLSTQKKLDATQHLFEHLNEVQSNLIVQKNKVLGQVLRLQQELLNERDRTEQLRTVNALQTEIIHYQKRTILFVSIIVIILLVTLIFVFRLWRKLKSTQDALRETSRRTVIAANTMEAGLVSLDENGFIRFYNRKAEKYFFPEKEGKLKRGRKLTDLLSNDERRAE
jgi:PAS domain-containing protein